jgi:lysophospholipase L1-like esterase
MTNFGDSISCGFYAYPVDGSGYIHSSAGYAGLLDAQIGAPAQNLCRPGDTAADMTRQWVYPNATPTLGASQAYTVMIGVNDANGCGTGYGCVAAFTQTLAASLAWLAMPASDKVLGANMTASAGAWTNDQTSGAASGFSMGMATTTNGATLSFTAQQAVAGRNLYLAYRVFAPWRVTTGTATLAIDGVTVGTMSTMPSTGLWIDTVNGTTDTVFLLSVPLGAVGAHSVTVTVTSPNGGFFSLLWAGASQGDYATMPGAPRVVVGQIAGTTSAPLNETVAAYNVAIAPLVAGLAADGLNVTLAQTAATLDTTTDMSDELHPNNAGHAKLAAVFASALQTVGP